MLLELFEEECVIGGLTTTTSDETRRTGCGSTSMTRSIPFRKFFSSKSIPLSISFSLPSFLFSSCSSSDVAGVASKGSDTVCA